MDVGTAEHYQGRFASSLAHFEAALALYDPERVHSIRSITGDPGLAAVSCTAWNLLRLGWPDRALARARKAVVLAEKLDQPFTLAYTIFFETVVHAFRRDATAQLDRAAAVIAIGDAQGFRFWQGMGRFWHAAARVALGDAEAIDDVLAGLKLSAGTGGRAGAPGGCHLLGRSFVMTGRLDEAQAAVETGLAISAQTGQAFFDAELLLLQGEIVLASGGAAADAETLMRRALDVARAQESRAGELRAALSLACLWRNVGRSGDARALLAPVYGWFTEGFDTGDLADARALLEMLPA
jgi:predicted ATPase